MKFVTMLLLASAFTLTSCAHHGHHHNAKSCCADSKSCDMKDKKDCCCKEGKCDLKKQDTKKKA